MWKLFSEPKHLDDSVVESDTFYLRNSCVLWDE